MRTIFKMSNGTYDVWKWIAQVGLPAFGTLYFALAGIWGLPKAEEVVGTIVAIDTFLGVALGISTKIHEEDNPLSAVGLAGEIVVNTNDPNKDTFRIEMEKPLPDAIKDGSVRLGVRHES